MARPNNPVECYERNYLNNNKKQGRLDSEGTFFLNIGNTSRGVNRGGFMCTNTKDL